MTANNPSVELLPCPFCGGNDLRQGQDDFGWYQVYCSSCGGCIEDSIPHKAIAAWNRRAFTEPACGEVEELMPTVYEAGELDEGASVCLASETRAALAAMKGVG